MTTLNNLPVVIDGPGIYTLRNGGRACIHEVKPFVDPRGLVTRDEVTAFEAKGAIEQMFRGKVRFRQPESWHVSGRRLPVTESAYDIMSKEEQ